jgi:hypothetical protein
MSPKVFSARVGDILCFACANIHKELYLQPFMVVVEAYVNAYNPMNGYYLVDKWLVASLLQKNFNRVLIEQFFRTDFQ